MKTAVVPGSFDPVTLGHADVIRKSAALFDRVVVLVTVNLKKKTLFSPEERIALIRQAFQDLPNVEVDQCSGLLAGYVKSLGAHAIVKGLRNATDYDNEKTMAVLNQDLCGVPTLLMPADPLVSHISSTMARQVASLGGELDTLVPPCVACALREKFRKRV